MQWYYLSSTLCSHAEFGTRIIKIIRNCSGSPGKFDAALLGVALFFDTSIRVTSIYMFV